MKMAVCLYFDKFGLRFRKQKTSESTTVLFTGSHDLLIGPETYNLEPEGTTEEENFCMRVLKTLMIKKQEELQNFGMETKVDIWEKNEKLTRILVTVGGDFLTWLLRADCVLEMTKVRLELFDFRAALLDVDSDDIKGSIDGDRLFCMQNIEKGCRGTDKIQFGKWYEGLVQIWLKPRNSQRF